MGGLGAGTVRIGGTVVPIGTGGVGEGQTPPVLETGGVADGDGTTAGTVTFEAADAPELDPEAAACGCTAGLDEPCVDESSTAGLVDVTAGDPVGSGAGAVADAGAGAGSAIGVSGALECWAASAA